MTFLGRGETFNHSQVLFFLVGTVFGCSYSMTQINVIDWILKSPQWKKILRTIIGIGLAVGIYFLFNETSNESYDVSQQMTEYFFQRALPSMLTGFLIFGPYIILCDKAGLNATHKKEAPEIRVDRYSTNEKKDTSEQDKNEEK